MSQNHASTEEVLHVVEAIEAGEKSEVDTVPVVVPPESTAEPEVISKPEEGNQPAGDEPREEKPHIESGSITAQVATEEGQEAETTEHVAIEATELGNEVQQTEASDELSPEEKKLKLKKERKERLKNFATTRFAPTAIESPVHFTPEYMEEIRDNEVEEEEQEQVVTFDEPTIGDGESVSSSVLTDDSEDYPFHPPKLVSLFPTYGFSDGPVDRNIFQSDVKYEDIDYSVSLTGISIVSTRTLKPNAIRIQSS